MALTSIGISAITLPLIPRQVLRMYIPILALIMLRSLLFQVASAILILPAIPSLSMPCPCRLLPPAVVEIPSVIILLSISLHSPSLLMPGILLLFPPLNPLPLILLVLTSLLLPILMAALRLLPNTFMLFQRPRKSTRLNSSHLGISYA